MLNRIFQRWRYGDAVIIVSGLPRSGTSMYMNMLQAGGLPLMTDTARAADHDNPKGYFETERVKRLAEETDKSWVRDARGKGLKVISHLLKELPRDNFYRIVFAMRDLGEVIASQNAMLSRPGQPNPATTSQPESSIAAISSMSASWRGESNMRWWRSTTRRHRCPASVAGHINRFLGGHLDTDRMAAVVDNSLYRNRAESPDPVCT